MELTILTGGGRIECLRCTAHSSRTGLQCGRPALKSSSTRKCQFHGGRGSGPKTIEGKARIAAANIKHGGYSKAASAVRAASLARLSQLEDTLYLLGMTSVGRTPGRKPNGYTPIRTLDEFMLVMFDTPQNHDGASIEEVQKNNRNTHRP